MRPQILFPLFKTVDTLPGVGPKIAKAIERLAGPHVVDLLWHLPASIIDRRYAPKLAEAEPGRIATLTLTIEAHNAPPRGSRAPYRIRATDGTAFIDLVFFHARGDYLKRILPPGEVRVVSGRVEDFQGGLQMAHPDHIAPPGEAEALMRVEPVYPMTADLAGKTLRKAIAAALDSAPELTEWQDAAWLDRRGWPTWRTALAAAHQPTGEASLEPSHPARQRLAFDELLANQLALLLVRQRMKRRKGRSFQATGHLTEKVRAALPFALTASQDTALVEIGADMASPDRMLRLLQGDVGSGKTVVALLAMLGAVEAGSQAALLAPTEILARQHLETIAPLAKAAGLDIALLTGRDRGKTRQETLARLADGSLRLIVGTHALLQEGVDFADLGLAVVDEQHRFGVHQRLALSSKGKAADVLVMTATPIPRTLSLTAYGDMDTSKLIEKPPGRKPIDTRAISAERMPDLEAAIARKMEAGEGVYWVCPLVEESESSDLQAATQRFAHLKRQFGDKVGLIHGQMKGPDKDAAIDGFIAGRLRILVATTVIEVGVNVPDATVMVIEHAERFGLAQLHQLRGRVGRGTKSATCILLYHPPLTETARKRIDTLRNTEDGFVIAEADLQLRGAGEVLGTKQSGVPDWRVADIAAHGDLLMAARDDARLVLDRDPDLSGARGEALRLLLYLFERDAAIAYLRSG